MIRFVQIFLFSGLGAAFASGCDRNNGPVGTETAARDGGASLEPTVNSNEGVRGCTATAKCPNGAELSCKVTGSGTCSGTDGVGVQCITYSKDGNPEESGGLCGGQ